MKQGMLWFYHDGCYFFFRICIHDSIQMNWSITIRHFWFCLGTWFWKNRFTNFLTVIFINYGNLKKAYKNKRQHLRPINFRRNWFYFSLRLKNNHCRYLTFLWNFKSMFTIDNMIFNRIRYVFLVILTQDIDKIILI
jgi:hypothetical protein